MTFEKYRKTMAALTEKMERAKADDHLRLAMLTAIEICELGLAHPEHWSDQTNMEQIKTQCQAVIERAEKALGID